MLRGDRNLADELIRVTEDSARGSFFLAVGNLVSTVISALGVFIIARLLEPELYGVYTLVFTVPAILLLFVNLGVNEGLTKFSASLKAKGETEKLAKLIKHGILFNLAIAFSFFTLCFIFSDFLSAYFIARPEYGGYVRIAAFIILFQALFNTANAVFVGFYKMEFNAFNLIIAAIVKLLVSTLLIIIGLGVLGALTGLITSFLIASVLGMLIIVSKIYRSLKNHDDDSCFFGNVKKLLRYGFPLYAAAIAAGFYLQFQNIILAFFTSNIEVGYFKAAMNFVTLIGVISISFSTSVFPAFARLEDKLGQLKEFFSLSVKYTTLILLPVVLLIIIFSREIVLLIYGSAYISTASYLILIALQFLLAGLGSIVLGSFFNGIGKTRINLQISSLNLIIFLPLAFLLTQPYGVYGLIVSNLVATSVSTIYGAFIAKREFSAAPNWKITGKIYLASMFSVAPVLILEIFLDFSIILKLLVGTLILISLYLACLAFLHILSWQELTDLERNIAKTRVLALIMKPFFFYERILLGWLGKT